MKFKKLGAIAACGILAASLGIFGCSNNSASSSASASSSSSSSEASSSSAAAEATEVALLNDGQLTVITSPDYPPFENMENGEFVGYEMDLFKAVADEMGVEFVPVQMQFDAIIPAISAGGQADVGVSGISVTPERAQEITFTQAFYVDNQAVAVMKDSGITEENAADELNKEGVVIAVQTGTTGETYAQENFPNATIQGYGNSTDCFAAMQSGQANAVCTNLAVVDKMLATAYPDAQIVMQDATGEEYAAVVSNDNPALVEAINKALANLEANGTIDQLTTKWF